MCSRLQPFVPLSSGTIGFIRGLLFCRKMLFILRKQVAFSLLLRYTDRKNEEVCFMEMTVAAAELALQEAHAANPGPWEAHSRYVALACRNIAEKCPHLSEETAYLYGLLHDIGRHAGVTSERHLIDGYRYCMARGWEKAAQICITHAFMIPDISTSIGVFDMPQEDKRFIEEFVRQAEYDDYDHLVQLCDALALPTGFCLLEKRFVDVAIRYGTHPATVPRWKRILEIKAHFESVIGCPVYHLLPGVIENSFR